MYKIGRRANSQTEKKVQKVNNIPKFTGLDSPTEDQETWQNPRQWNRAGARAQWPKQPGEHQE